jgi:hypothetical protein
VSSPGRGLVENAYDERVTTGTSPQQRSGVGGGVFLVGLGMLFITGWWWPGILVVIGLAIASERALAGRFGAALGVLAVFLGIPLAIALLSKIDIPWTGLIALLLIVLGGVGIFKALTGRN